MWPRQVPASDFPYDDHELVVPAFDAWLTFDATWQVRETWGFTVKTAHVCHTVANPGAHCAGPTATGVRCGRQVVPDEPTSVSEPTPHGVFQYAKPSRQLRRIGKGKRWISEGCASSMATTSHPLAPRLLESERVQDAMAGSSPCRSDSLGALGRGS